MSNVPGDDNYIIENRHVNHSSKNMINLSHPLKNTIPEQLIFFKEDILKDVKQIESQITIKCNSELNKNSNKIIKMQETVDEMNQKLEKISTLINMDVNLEDRTNKLSDLFSKLEQSVLLQDVQIKNTNKKLTDTINRFDEELSNSIIYPTVIGPTGKYKTFHQFIDFVMVNINSLLFFKDKLYSEFKDFKTKVEVNMSNFKVQLDYQIKNCNAFTSASIRASEQKIMTIMKELIKAELDEIDKKFEYFSKAQEKKFIKIIENSEIIKTIKKNFEKIDEDLKRISKGITIKSKYENTDYNKKRHKKDRISNNTKTLKKASSVVKKYIEGKIKNNEVFQKRRKSVEGNIFQLKNIDEKLDIKRHHDSHKNMKRASRKLSNNMNSSGDIIKKKSLASEPRSEDFNESESTPEEESESEKDINHNKEKIKNQINEILIKNDVNFKNLVEERDSFIFNYLQELYKDSKNPIDDKNLVIQPNNTKYINNEIKLIKDNETVPINKNLYITNNENCGQNENKENKENKDYKNPEMLKRVSLKNIELSKINNPDTSKNLNINKKYEQSDIKKLISQVKQKSKKDLIPNKTPVKLPQQKYKSLAHNKNLISLTYKTNTRNKIIFNPDIKSNSQNDINIKNNPISLHKTFQTNNLIIKDVNKINMNFSDYSENNKEKDNQKMKRIFDQIGDIIQEDEKVIIKNRFTKYGYSKDIIFAEDKKNINNNKNSENKNNIFDFNNFIIRPKSRKQFKDNKYFSYNG